MTIPHIIHQIWYQGADAVPERYRAYARGWQALHPSWTYRLWDRDACRALLAERYPDDLDMWERFPLDIQRIDAIRYFILDAHGGIYLDMDIECLKPIDSLFEDSDFLLSQTIHYNMAVMASAPAHPFWRPVLAGLRETSRRPRPRGLRRLLGGEARHAAQTCGPIFFARMVQESGLDTDARTRVCPGHVFEPLAPTLVNGRPRFSKDTSHSFAIHHEDLNWMPLFHRYVSILTRPLFRLVLSRGK